MAMRCYYPVFLHLSGRPCVVVGGGKVAERKALSLLKSGASVTIISPGLTKRLKKEAEVGNIKHISRKYKTGDLKKAFLVIAATDSIEINKKISEDAPHLVNVVDVPSLCNFIVPSVVRRGPLTIAISTSGASPSIAKAIRKELEKIYPPAFGKYLDSLGKKRAKAMEEIKDKKERERFLKSLATEEIIKKLRKKT